MKKIINTIVWISAVGFVALTTIKIFLERRNKND